MAIKKVEQYVGECRKALPFGDTYWAIGEDNRPYLTCTHEPPHDAELVADGGQPAR